MSVILNTPEKLILRLNISESLANAIRRSINEVPVLAIDEVEIFKNDSALYDEVLAHRLGLLPIKTEKSMSDKTKINFKLSKKGPCTVYASDLSGNAEIVFPQMPLTILNDGAKLELTATTILGTGLEHAKFIPGLCYYRNLYEVISSEKVDNIIQKSKSEFKPEKSGTKWICDLSDILLSEIRSVDESAISDSLEFLFFVESYGNMPAKDILSGAIKALDKNLDVFEKALK